MNSATETPVNAVIAADRKSAGLEEHPRDVSQRSDDDRDFEAELLEGLLDGDYDADTRTLKR